MSSLKTLILLFMMWPGFSFGQAVPSTPIIERFELKNPPVAGKTRAGQIILLGGFSGLRFLGKTSEGQLQFLSHTDRGPNPEAYEENGSTKRPFLLPDFNPRLVILLADPVGKTLTVRQQVFLKSTNGKPVSGLPPSSERQEKPVDVFGNKLAYNPSGLDLESIDVANDHSYWMVDEYGPSIIHFTSQGRLLEGFYPGKGLPLILKHRQLNRGFEGVALQGSKVYAILQSPLQNPAKNPKKDSKIIRLIEFDIYKKQTTGQFIYLLDKKGSDRIGDMLSLGNGRFLVIEQNDQTGENAYKKIYLIALSHASNLQSPDPKLKELNENLESQSADSLKALGIKTLQKELVLDLAALGIRDSKIEGISLVRSNQIALIIDNDFYLNGKLDKKTGIAGLKHENSRLYLITFDKPL
ncbi:esterase-like activity of phytase family protein [Legionella sp. 16cNR16C]|uniref:esterase-like activity of phytase family protein n=1 Tax=Legionella sp. 16cNR16C TaxID=2905656 RepID=UPI001E3A715E|nr:esterase-like activity of phytase family protein [Legionella sp. 16cNR16C]MCE3046018.1 esterase-like activity of phytase family protein [Legionella sp. 16cNR16C]